MSQGVQPPEEAWIGATRRAAERLESDLALPEAPARSASQRRTSR
jgi:hypothetical protein